ncbi:ErmE/ErmH/ErmO/ErmR family 23S rRNA (adenine(2058)-N(6))-methyltransferase [Nocardia sp. NBC_01503]|uniref:ErmE/ErmH/ErmO/ErmR family 23S rRNA (adenine(2058)-N(6))-methyltransferase n=1 Tax=Nocardia sp. NBC_01503 TaxID=2975997 RepID=UPI003FA5AB06
MGNGGRTPRDRARREYSQNFLVDRHAIDLIVETASPTGLVLEPGAGEGAITRALSERGARVTAYEIDPLLAGKLAARTRESPEIQVVRGDFTKAAPPREPFAVVGNIPFSATAAIVNWCLTAPTLTSATLLTQREYARKRTGDYGRWSELTVTTWPRFTWTLHARINRENFRPIPLVDAAILQLRRRPHPLVENHQAFKTLVALGFTGIGGSVRASLRPHYRHLDRALSTAGITPDTVVGYVHPDQWLTLHHSLPTNS